MRPNEMQQLRSACDYDPYASDEQPDGGIDALIDYKDALEELLLEEPNAITVTVRFTGDLSDTDADAAKRIVAATLEHQRISGLGGTFDVAEVS